MNDYTKAVEFWNEVLKGSAATKVPDKWVTDDTFNRVIKEVVKPDDVIVDFGSGSGWGLFEIFNTVKFKQGLGIDTSVNGIEYANKSASLSNLNDALKFIVGDHSLLDNYCHKIDVIFSCNVLDVLPDEIIAEILLSFHRNLKDGGYIIICLNPDFTKEELSGLLKMENKGHYYYKNDILRCNYKSIEEWTSLFSSQFEVVEQLFFTLVDREIEHPRKMFLLKK